ncbi:mitochondrial inner membrane protease subunit 1 isoform X2 [Carex littledalei]|uniref:Mitochondrial inner membrane protease subunit 1 isoform X2 n=1 Tax=Carex littledalei TaxID=544730 RepID=A0A833VEG3_9POAL|nr:mitochondrial inner membrane protease subunit 1 isoform X2 [Carex littledalei]
MDYILLLSKCRQVIGPSMLPTLNQAGDILAVNMVPKWWGQFNTGDVVLMRSPGNPTLHLAKRILGVEGEKVTYLVDPNNSKTIKTVLVPEGHVWVQGDNIHKSYDSRKFGPVPRGLIQGRIFYRVWPPEKIGPIDSKVNPNEPPTK